MFRHTAYVGLFSILGLLVGLISVGLFEIGTLKTFTKDVETLGIAFPSSELERLRDVALSLLVSSGIVLGFREGTYWWKKEISPQEP